jgi:hypothetical protein
MTLSRLYKCYGDCNEKYIKEQLIKVGAQNFCIPCATKKQKETKDRETLYKTIQTIYKIPYPNGQMLRQIKQFKEDRNYTYEGMTKCLCYFVKVQKKQPFLNGGLSFLPYHYDSAVKYYEDLEERRKNAKDADNSVTRITIPIIKHDTSYYKKKKIIPMEANLLNDN